MTTQHSPEVCGQEGNIATLLANDKTLFETLKEMKDSHKRLVDVLEKIAEQGEQIIHLRADVDRNRRDTDGLFDRMRTAEVKIEGERVKLGFIMTGLAAGVSALTTAAMKLFGK